MQPPRIIETARLRLRPPTEDDVDAIFEYASDSDVTVFMDWRRLADPSEARDFMARTEESWRLGTEFTWVIAEQDRDEVIGATSIRVRDADADFGYVLNRRFWERGFATEAGRAVVSWATGVRQIPCLWATCDVENHRSQRVLEKLGLRRAGLVPGGAIRPNLSEQPRESYRYERMTIGDPK